MDILAINPQQTQTKFGTGSTPMTPDQIKTKFRMRGLTISQWARDHGYKPAKVIRVLNGFDKGNYGQAHEIAVKLGMKPQASEAN
jgi:gp16 family phage-associated protein